MAGACWACRVADVDDPLARVARAALLAIAASDAATDEQRELDSAVVALMDGPTCDKHRWASSTVTQEIGE